MVALIFVKCEPSLCEVSKFYNNCMIKEPLEVTLFAFQANFRFTGTNFADTKSDKDSLN